MVLYFYIFLEYVLKDNVFVNEFFLIIYRLYVY